MHTVVMMLQSYERQLSDPLVWKAKTFSGPTRVTGSHSDALEQGQPPVAAAEAKGSAAIAAAATRSMVLGNSNDHPGLTSSVSTSKKPRHYSSILGHDLAVEEEAR
jgi:hypothetical protein